MIINKDSKLTLDLMDHLGTPQFTVDFIKVNNLEGLPLGTTNIVNGNDPFGLGGFFMMMVDAIQGNPDIITIEYDDDDNVVSSTYGGNKSTFTRDDQGRVVIIDNDLHRGGVSSIVYKRDEDGNTTKAIVEGSELTITYNDKGLVDHADDRDLIENKSRRTTFIRDDHDRVIELNIVEDETVTKVLINYVIRNNVLLVIITDEKGVLISFMNIPLDWKKSH